MQREAAAAAAAASVGVGKGHLHVISTRCRTIGAMRPTLLAHRHGLGGAQEGVVAEGHGRSDK